MLNKMRSTQKRTPRRRKGALLSVELVFVLPILLIILFGFVELSLLLMGMQRVQAASSAACRVATLPATDADLQQQAMREAAAGALGKAGMVETFQMNSDIGPNAGDPVAVEISVPMAAAAPDLLRVIGFSLQGRQLVVRTQMSKQ
jgi:Flp pilus assembly protein TadG